MISDSEAAVSDEAKKKVATAISAAFEERPPTVAVVGASGTGKSSTLNALFGQRLPVSHSVRGTVAFTQFKLHAHPRDPLFRPLPFVFMDAPGLGEDLRKDPEYLEAYDKHLPECDLILWIVSARNRALALDQQFLQRFGTFSERIILGINQVDIVHPNNWDARTNLPSPEQEAIIDTIVEDRRQRLSTIVNRELMTVAYSAEKRWRLVELLNAVMSACASERRFMFDMLSHVRPDDFMPRTLSKRDRKRIEEALPSREDRGWRALLAKWR